MTRIGLTAGEAGAQLGVPAGTINLWKHRKRIAPIGSIRGRGRPVPLYDVEDLRPLAEAYLRRLERTRTRRS